jgi:hypothetical protein
MKMSGFIAMLLAGLVLGGCLFHRHRQRAVAHATPVAPRPADDLRAVRERPQDSKLALQGDFDWRGKLRREEERQRPQERRN